MSATFKADETFTIRKRGLVVSGEILDGTVKAGMTVQIPSWPDRMTIDSVEILCRTDDHLANVGLLFRCQDEDVYARWRMLNVKEQILEIQDEASN